MQTITIKLTNLNCPSCAVDIDLALEEIPGIKSSKTNYAKSETIIDFDAEKIKLDTIKKTIFDLGYEAI